MNRERFEERAAREFTAHGREPMTAALIGGGIYGFGSEIATLRCFMKYRFCEGVNHGFSENRNQWYFCYDAKFVGDV